MGALKLSSDLRPLSDLKSGAAEVVRQVTETGRAVVLTRHGRGVAVMLSLESYEELEESAEQRWIAAGGVPLCSPSVTRSNGLIIAA